MAIEITREKGLVIVVGKEEAKKFIMKILADNPILYEASYTARNNRCEAYDRVCSDPIVQQIREFAKD